MQMISSIRRDFVVRHLKSQLDRMHTVLLSLEEESEPDCDYARNSLKAIEEDLRKVRKLCSEN